MAPRRRTSNNPRPPIPTLPGTNSRPNGRPQPSRPSPTGGVTWGPTPQQPSSWSDQYRQSDFGNDPRWAGERRDMNTQAAATGTDILGAAPTDPYGNQDPFTALMMLMSNQQAGGPSRGGGGGGGGGRGGAGNPDPLGWNAIAMSQATQTGYDNILKAMDEAAAAQAKGFDTRQQGLESARTQGEQRLSQLLGDLGSQAATTAGNVANVYGQADTGLQNLMNQYSQMAAARQPAMGRTMSAFGVDPSQAVSSPNLVQDMITAQRANLAGISAADQALLTNRNNVYQGLNADVTSQRQLQFDNMMAKLLADRQAATSQSATQRAQTAMDLQRELLRIQADEQARRAQYG